VTLLRLCPLPRGTFQLLIAYRLFQCRVDLRNAGKPKDTVEDVPDLAPDRSGPVGVGPAAGAFIGGGTGRGERGDERGDLGEGWFGEMGQLKEEVGE
jgi:hypothetical protein